MCSSAVLRIIGPVINRLLAPGTVEITPQSLQEGLLVVIIQTTVIQHTKLVTLSKTQSWSRWQK